MTDCVVCIRRDTDDTVCRGCRLRLSLDLAELPDLHALLPAALARTDQTGEHVAGTPDPPAPVNIDVLDLLGEPRVGNPAPITVVTNGHRRSTTAAAEWPEDIVGDQAVAGILDSWCRDWRETRDVGENLPQFDVHTLARWLRVRLDWACDHHPAVDEFAHEIHDATSRLRGLLHLKFRTETLKGECPTCDTRSLFRTVDPRHGASDWIECGQCGRLWTEDEYERLAVILVDEDRRETMKT